MVRSHLRRARPLICRKHPLAGRPTRAAGSPNLFALGITPVDVAVNVFKALEQFIQRTPTALGRPELSKKAQMASCLQDQVSRKSLEPIKIVLR
jgi:hypothetical protein